MGLGTHILFWSTVILFVALFPAIWNSDKPDNQDKPE